MLIKSKMSPIHAISNSRGKLLTLNERVRRNKSALSKRSDDKIVTETKI